MATVFDLPLTRIAVFSTIGTLVPIVYWLNLRFSDQHPLRWGLALRQPSFYALVAAFWVLLGVGLFGVEVVCAVLPIAISGVLTLGGYVILLLVVLIQVLRIDDMDARKYSRVLHDELRTIRKQLRFVSLNYASGRPSKRAAIINTSYIVANCFQLVSLVLALPAVMLVKEGHAHLRGNIADWEDAAADKVFSLNWPQDHLSRILEKVLKQRNLKSVELLDPHSRQLVSECLIDSGPSCIELCQLFVEHARVRTIEKVLTSQVSVRRKVNPPVRCYIRDKTIANSRSECLCIDASEGEVGVTLVELPAWLRRGNTVQVRRKDGNQRCKQWRAAKVCASRGIRVTLEVGTDQIACFMH